jgi:hypothetical protein
LAHEVAERLGLKHKSQGEGRERFLRIEKT